MIEAPWARSLRETTPLILTRIHWSIRTILSFLRRDSFASHSQAQATTSRSSFWVLPSLLPAS